MLDINNKILDTEFIWAQALWLPRWKVHVIPTNEQRQNIELHAVKMQTVKYLWLKNKMTITSWLRPELYNDWSGIYGVKGAQNSPHKLGLATDFIIEGVSCDEVRRVLQPKLVQMKLRMEDLPGANWVHVDSRHVGPGGNYFKP